MALPEEASQWVQVNNGPYRLAEMLSLAAMADPGLVRAARLWLGLTVEAELDLWFGPLVASATSSGIVFSAVVLPELRAGLKQDPERLQKAWELTTERHFALSLPVRSEEQLTYWSLTDPGKAKMEAEKLFNRALVSVVRNKQPQFAAWAARALPRLPSALREGKSARYLATAAESQGFKIAGNVPTAGPPPAWMTAESTSETLIIGVALYPSRIEFRYPPGADDVPITAPKNRRVWVSWWESGERKTREIVAPKNQSADIAAAADEFTVEAPGIPAVLIQDKAALRESRSVLLLSEAQSHLDLVEYIRAHLELRGHHVALQASGPAIQQDYVLYAGTSPQLPLERNCVPQVYLRTPGAPAWPDISDGSFVIDCTSAGEWDPAVQKILDILARPLQRAGPLEGVPAAPPYYERDLNQFETLRGILLSSDMGVITLVGEQGSGRTLLAADALRDCSVRCRFPGGIVWFHSDNAWPSKVPASCCFVVRDPQVQHLRSVVEQGEENRAKNCRILLLLRGLEETRSKFGSTDWLERASSVMTMRPFADTTLEQIFVRASVGHEGQSASLWQLRELWRGSPRLAANAGRFLAGLSPEALNPNRFEVITNAIQSKLPDIKRLVEQLDLVAPLAATPPQWPLAGAEQRVWNRYFEPQYRERAAEAFEILAQSGLTHNGVILPEVLQFAPTLAKPAHDRIVRSYEDECGGDWAICEDDGYYLEHFAYHLVRSNPGRLPELTENMDWLQRANRDQPGWAEEISAASATPVEATSDPEVLEMVFGGYPGRTGQMALGRKALRISTSSRILVVGTGRSNGLSYLDRAVSVVMGRELARHGFALITGGWPGVDYLIAEAYAHQLDEYGIPDENGLLHVVATGKEPDFPRGAVEHAEQVQTESAAIAQSVAVIAIGGEGGTLKMCRMAQQMGKLVFPVPGTGGDAAVFYEEMKRMNMVGLEKLDVPLDSKAVIYQLVKDIVSLLPSTFGRPISFAS